MCLFRKTTIEERRVFFALDEEESCKDLIAIKAYTTVGTVRKYLFTDFHLKDIRMYENGDYEEIKQMLSDTEGETVTVQLIFRGRKLEDVRFDVADLARTFHDDRLLQLEKLISGVSDAIEEY